MIEMKIDHAVGQTLAETEVRIVKSMTPYMATIYFFLTATVKTTVCLNSTDYRRLKALASAEGRSAAELIRAAVAEYAERRAPRTQPTSLGAGCSRDGRLAERSEDLLDGIGREPELWPRDL